MLNLFYGEPDDDRWLPFDRYPRRVVRRIVRGQPTIGGHKRILLNLCAGLDRIGVRYRVNDYAHIRKNPNELACVIGKPYLVDAFKWGNPILFGAAVYSHPIDDPTLLQRLPIGKVLVPGRWMEEMCQPYWGASVQAWPVGIDTDRWCPRVDYEKKYDILLYDKVRWEHDRYNASLIDPIREFLNRQGITFRDIRYGSYREDNFNTALLESRAMIFLCEHETQGIAYQQALSCGVPILAWDRGGFWQDPSYYPDRVTFSPVTSVPYWDERCGERFEGLHKFEKQWTVFWDGVRSSRYRPRDYILENLTLEKCARAYVGIVHELTGSVVTSPGDLAS